MKLCILHEEKYSENNHSDWTTRPLQIVTNQIHLSIKQT
jgi:hypothetical protein